MPDKKSHTIENIKITFRGRHPYFRFLKTTFRLPTVNSDTNTQPAKKLQTLINTRQIVEYEKQRKTYEFQGHNFRLTDMVVYETFPTKRKIDVRIAVQVKAHTITWYFWAPGGKDQFPQEFRDILYDSAAQAHKKTTHGCDLYYRGSNAFHVKTMHTKEEEAGQNHNHYRIRDNRPVRPKDFIEHMVALKHTKAFVKGFFVDGEIEDICNDFIHWHFMWTYKGLEGTNPSPKERYMARKENMLNQADFIEFKMFGTLQEPCRIKVNEFVLDFKNARNLINKEFTPQDKSVSNEACMEMTREIKKLTQQFNAIMRFRKMGGSRALGSERAMTRQIYGSNLPVIKVVAPRSDGIAKVPPIPKWAKHALLEVKKVMQAMEEMASCKINAVNCVSEREQHSFFGATRSIGNNFAELLRKRNLKAISQKADLAAPKEKKRLIAFFKCIPPEELMELKDESETAQIAWDQQYGVVPCNNR